MKMHLRYTNQPPRLNEEKDTLYQTVIWNDWARWKSDDYQYDEQIWERWSLPLGNGYFGASVFGYTDRERIQITENSLANPYRKGNKSPMGINSFAEITVDFGHTNVKNYLRELSLDDAVASVSYELENGAKYKREYFTSHPDRLMVMRFSCDRSEGVSLYLSIKAPHLRKGLEGEEAGYGKSGFVKAEGNLLTLWGELEYYGIKYEGQIKVINRGGSLYSRDGGIAVEQADEVIALFSCGTNYRLESRVFTEQDPKKKLSPYPHPHGELTERLLSCEKKSYGELLSAHLEDYTSLFGRASLSLGEYSDTPTDTLIRNYRDGKESRYLEALLFQYGRYLLISSSRKGSLPANLQGIWNAYDRSPWSAGYWHNINVQMNYWPSCIANIAECFLPYSDYNQAYMALARVNADEYVSQYSPAKLDEPGKNGWIIGTGAWPYTIEGISCLRHSGPGTGAFTSLLFWDYYDYTRDIDFLRNICYPVLREMSIFFSKILIEQDGLLLISPSASPENEQDGSYYQTVGCAFDQQMVYENYKRTIEAAQVLEIDEPIISLIRSQIDRLEPVIVGKSGQVKEYREEEYYSDIGEYTHRHVSQLVGMYPGTLINATTPEWMDAATVTLTERGDKSTGWAAAHRLCLWTRARNGKKAMDLVRSMVVNNIMYNLWDTHPPFQIDGNFGFTAGVAEMLVQSQAGFIELLPALPAEWKEGSFSGLVARGSFTVDCCWRDSSPTEAKIVSRAGGTVRVKCDGIASAQLYLNGNRLENYRLKDGIAELNLNKNDELVIKLEK